jgi:hypothetical protein
MNKFHQRLKANCLHKDYGTATQPAIWTKDAIGNSDHVYVTRNDRSLIENLLNIKTYAVIFGMPISHL